MADPPLAFDIALETSLTMAQGDIVEIPVTIQRSNFDGPITFSVPTSPSRHQRNLSRRRP